MSAVLKIVVLAILMLFCAGDLTLYGYDCHGRLTSSQTASPLIGVSVTQDFSTEYTYDRNANLTSLTRHGVTDIINGRRSYGIQNSMTFSYSGNRLQTAEITADGAEYEGRTGVPQYSASAAAFLYDSNGNMTADAVRGITRITYSRLNKPETVTFAGGQRQTITYDGFGNKKQTDYSVGPETVIGGDIPADDTYTVSSSRVYAGSHVFADGQLEYSGFPGGYFDPTKGAMYYITDWQGNNAAVVNSSGAVVQNTDYYPYGEPTVEPSGQRYLFGGKEREHAAGRNTYDFGARSLTPYGIWPSPDPLAEKFYPISPYSYCAGDPINRVDRDGRDWTIDEEDGQLRLQLTGVVVNSSSQKIDINKLAKEIEIQLENVFTFSNENVKVSMTANIRSITNVEDINFTDHVFNIVDVVNPKKKTAIASTNRLGGLGIKISTKVASETLSGNNTRTIAHEVGHSGGLQHTNESNRKDDNLMTQIKFLGKDVDKNGAIHLQTNQIKEIVDKYNSGQLNQYTPLKERFNIQLHNRWPFITLTQKYLDQ